MPEADRHDPFLNYNFAVEIEGDVIGDISEVDVPEARIEFANYREGGLNQADWVRRLPGRVDYGSLVLRRGFTADHTFFQWWRRVAEGNLDRRNITVTLRDQRGRDVARWAFYNALPAKYTGPSLRARGNDVAMESLELEFERMELIE